MDAGESSQGAAGGRDGEAVADRIANELNKLGGYRRGRLSGMLHQVGAVDRAVYKAIATVPTPAFDDAMRRLSRAADYSTTWIAIAGGVALTGPAGRRAAARGLVAIAVASTIVNLGVKSVSG